MTSEDRALLKLRLQKAGEALRDTPYANRAEAVDEALALIDRLFAQQEAQEREKEILRGALADIANASDMTLTMARKKAARVYAETAAPSGGRPTQD